MYVAEVHDVCLRSPAITYTYNVRVRTGTVMDRVRHSTYVVRIPTNCTE